MKQFGLCIMKGTGFEFHAGDTYSTIDEKLRNLFPKLFDWICESKPYDTTPSLSSWLICMKPPYRKHLIVFSDDQALPTGFDIITACQLGKSKAGVHDRILYLGKPLAYYYSDESTFVTKWLSIVILVTRDRVPQETLKTWRPRISSQRPSIHWQAVQNGSDIDDEFDSDNSSDGTSSPTFIPVPFPCTQLPSHPGPSRNRSEDEVAQDIISISSSSNSSKRTIY